MIFNQFSKWAFYEFVNARFHLFNRLRAFRRARVLDEWVAVYSKYRKMSLKEMIPGTTLNLKWFENRTFEHCLALGFF